MPAKRKSGRWAKDTKAVRKESQALIGQTKDLLDEIMHPEREPNPKRRAALEDAKRRREKLELAKSGDTRALIECGIEFLGQGC